MATRALHLTFLAPLASENRFPQIGGSEPLLEITLKGPE